MSPMRPRNAQLQPRLFPLLAGGLTALLLTLSPKAQAQFSIPLPSVPIPGIPGVPSGMDIPGLSNLVKKEPPITTSFADARNKLFLADDFGATSRYTRLTDMPRSKQGGFLLRPGFYELTLQSYCLHAGTHGPSKGEGYLTAPLKGPKQQIIRHILQNSVQQADIPQQEIQLLIWAILARTKIQDLQPNLQRVAGRLLTAAEIADLNGGAWGMIPPEALQRVTANLPAPARRVLEAENQIRQRLTGSSSSFADIERLAVLAGDPGRSSGPDIPRGRWSDYPGGIYVRYYPSGYSRTRVQVYVPDQVKQIEYDPSVTVAVPSDTNRQRLSQSSRPAIEQ